MKFYRCEHCGNIIAFAENKGVPVMCCGKKMAELVPNTTEAATEKHLPVIAKNENGVVEIVVGSTLHPMLPEHFIGWVAIETKEGNQRKVLTGEPKISFALTEGDELIAVYAYCNLHGLWKTEA
ncbi:MAG: desulfoferrodoxin [Clostridia bacterium]|nr:desulfoferrodoxin [Clostridia bacterium]